jgi:hypothetical protein
MRMLPPYIDNTTSNAERKMFRILQEATGLNEWYCLHSLGVSRHITKREGEIDFLLIGPYGIFVIEVKGGRVKREDGVWKFTDRYGRISTKKESPFAQARTALYSIKAELAQKFGDDIQGHVFGYGVAFPDITFSTESPEWDPATIFDSRDLGRPFQQFIDRISDYWRKRQNGDKHLDKDTAGKVVAYLRGNFETIRPVGLDIEDSETGLFELTKEQYGALDAMQNNERIIFTGPAGTGKTLLAIEKARRNNALGIPTLFLCFNRLLSLHLAEIVRNEKLEHVHVDSLHHFMHNIISRGGYSEDIERGQESPDLFSAIYPEYFLKAWGRNEPYEELIIDEGQDILTPEYITALDTVVKGGFQKGTWAIFMDPETQKDMFASFDEMVFKELLQYAASYQLTVNCRNTKPIAIQAEVISGYPLGKVKKVDGLPVKYIWYEGVVDQAAQVTECVNGLLGDGVKPQDIVILSTKRYQASLAGSGRLRLSTGFYQLGKGKTATHHNLIGCGSIQSYKGLESSVVILTDIEDIHTTDMNTVNYVGYSRARNALFVSINGNLKNKYREHFAEIASAERKK